MLKILLATTNQHKINEYRQMVQKYKQNIKLISLKDLGIENDDAPETSNTFIGNALQKAHYYWKKYQMPIICDDSGLEVFSLNNFPGINSKRWLEKKGFRFKINQLLTMIGSKNRDCQYVCSIAYMDRNKSKIFTSTIHGKLVSPIDKPEYGFGFDIGFYLPLYQKTFSELKTDVKNEISHRGQAFKALMTWLNVIYQQHDA